MHHDPKWRADLSANTKALGGSPVPIRIGQAAKIVGIPEAEAVNLCRRGLVLEAVKFGAGDYLVTIKALRAAWCKAKGLPSSSPRLAVRSYRSEVVS